MKVQFILVMIFLSGFVFGQKELCRTDIMNEQELTDENKIDSYLKYNFSNLWLQTDEQFVYGIIGKEYQKISIKIISVSKNLSQPNEYYVYGKSMVKGNVCEFVGKISITRIQEAKSQRFGVDDEYKGKTDKQGLLTAEYEFYENNKQSHVGVFKGQLQTKWYLTDNEMKYNDLDSVSDGYFNNAFVGTWKMYDSKLEKICHWGDYRVPNVDCDFDIGTAEFNVDAEKYSGKGWLDVILKNRMPHGGEVIQNKSDEPVKHWWE